MLFITILAVSLILAVLVFIVLVRDVESVIGAIFSTLGGLILGGLVFGIVAAGSSFFLFGLAATEGNRIDDEVVTTELQAIKTGDSITGYYRYIDSGRSIKYIYSDTDENGEQFFAAADVKAENARIYEDATGTPTLEVITKQYDNGWIAPFIWSGYSAKYVFHVPAGSVVQNYEITNE